MGILLRGLAPAAALLLSVGCLRDDPNHCKNDPAGVASVCDGTARFCNACASSEINRGCVASQPEPGCNYVDASVEDTTGTSTGSGSGSTSSGGADSSTGAAECVEEGAADPTCPAASPYCVAGRCEPCGNAADNFCVGVDGATPVCGTQGSCVECEFGDDARCEDSIVGPFCNPLGACSGCFRHDQCGLAGCDLQNNECLPEAQVLFVEGGGCEEADDTGNGSAGNPFCSLAKALGAADDRATLRVRGPGTYDDAAINVAGGRVLAVLGNSRVEEPTIGRVEAVTDARLYLDDVRVTDGANELVNCSGGALVWATGTTITGNPSGFGADLINCTLRLHSSVVSLNAEGGINATGQAHIDLVSAAVIANGDAEGVTHGIVLDGDATLSATHATLVQNFGVAPGRELSCVGPHTATLTNSIVVRSEGLSVAGCTNLTITQSAVTDTGLVNEDTGVVRIEYMPSYFADPPEGDPHLTAGSPFEDGASWQIGDAVVDLDGEPLDLQLGAANDFGCDQR